MIKIAHVNKRGRLMLGEVQKIFLKKQKGEGLGALLLPLAKEALSVFGLRKKKGKYGKKK